MLVGLPRVVAVPTALLFAAVVLVRHGDGWQIVLSLALCAFLAAAALTELERGRLPDLLLAAAAAIALGLGVLVDFSGQVERLLCAVAASGFMLLVALAWPGAGDLDAVKLAAVLGLFLGRDVAVAVLIAVALSIVVTVARASRAEPAAAPTASDRKRALLLIGAAGALVIGPALVDAYLDAF